VAGSGQRPIDRFRPEALRPLPDLLPDCRETKSLKVHTDFSICFDANRYTVPPRFIGKQVIAKADNETLTVYYNDKRIASHSRCWQRKQRIELPAHREAASSVLSQKHLSEDAAVFISLGEIAKIYLEKMATSGLPIKKNLKRLLHLKDEYGHGSMLTAIKRANNHNAYGAGYIENILYQEMTPSRNHPPVRVKNEDLNRIRLIEPNLAEYDTYVLKRRK
jgi:hypothetical protein